MTNTLMKTTHQNTVYPQTVEIPEPLEIHPSVSPLAAELLMKTAERLAAEPSSYNQADCAGRGTCNSPCCIIGHMLVFAGCWELDSHTSVARARIGLTQSQRDALYHASRWPILFQVADKSLREIIPAQGIARITHFLSTGQ